MLLKNTTRQNRALRGGPYEECARIRDRVRGKMIRCWDVCGRCLGEEAFTTIFSHYFQRPRLYTQASICSGDGGGGGMDGGAAVGGERAFLWKPSNHSRKAARRARTDPCRATSLLMKVR